MRRIAAAILLVASLGAAAETNAIKQFLADMKAVGGEVTVLEEYNERYMRLQLSDSATLEIFHDEAVTLNHMFVVMTVCAPQCSSCARVYNDIGEYLFPLEPTVTSAFPLATIDKETGAITWTDNNTWEYESVDN